MSNLNKVESKSAGSETSNASNQIIDLLKPSLLDTKENTIEGRIVNSFNLSLQGTLSVSEDIEDIEEIPFHEIDFIDPVEEFISKNPNLTERITSSVTIPASSYSSIGVEKEGVRKHSNQDYIYITNSCVIVCDGIGSGDLSDEVAKELAEQVSEFSPKLYSCKNEAEALAKVNIALNEINQVFIEKKEKDPFKYSESGSTLAAVFSNSNGKKLVFTLGDSEVIKLNLLGDVESLTSSYLDTLFGYTLEALGIQNPVRFSDLSFQDFVSQLRLEFPSINTSASTQDFFDVLCSSYPQLKGLIRAAQGYLQDEAKFKKGKQIVVKGAMGNVSVSNCNLKIVDQKQNEFLLTVTDGVTDQMTYDQIGQVFLYGSIKNIISEYLESNPNLINVKGIDSILDSDSIIDIDKKLNLSKIIKKLISKINPRKLFGKSDLLKEGDLRQVVLDGGTEELLKESLANMLDERRGFTGYKIPKKDNISLATI
ncbi:hypothetical protein HOL52_01525 [bacterium]|nr:hypothetical protein [bacterium]